MKKLVFLMFVPLVLLFSFSKDALNDENTDLKKTNVPVPMKMEMCVVPGTVFDFHVANTPVVDPSTHVVIIPDLYAASECLLSGHATHLGEFQQQSSMTIRSAYLDLTALPSQKVITVLEYDIRLVASNGDYCDGIVEVRIDRTDPSNRIVTGDLELSGGSGRFEDATGNCEVNGVLPCWNAEGTLEFSK